MNITTDDRVVQVPIEKGKCFYFGSSGIIWRILQIKDTLLTIISNDIVCEKAFDDQARNVEWEKTSIRNWLNNEFYQDAFSDVEKDAIQDSVIDTNARYGKVAITTTDKVYLLGNSETAFFRDEKDMECGKSWWLRSPTQNTYCAGVISSSGWFVNDTYVAKELGVRPVITINLKSEYMQSRIIENNGQLYINSPISYIKDGKLINVLPDITEFVIPENVYSISEECFARMTNLQSVSMSNNVIDIHKEAFKNCISLQEVILSQGLTTIHEKAFSGCIALSKIIIPASVKCVLSEAFEGCENLKDMVISNPETEIENKAFNGCRQLAGEKGYVIIKGKLHLYNGDEKSIQIPESVSVIAERAFANCTSLNEVVLTSKITEIEEKAFMGCESLSILTVPDELIKQINSKTIKLDLIKRIRVNDISQLTAKLRPIAAVTFAEDKESLDTDRAKSHLKYIKANVGKICDIVVKNPELLRLMIDENMIQKKDFEVYEKAAKTSKNKEVITLVKSIKF